MHAQRQPIARTARLERRTPLKRSTKPIPRVTKRRAKQLRDYALARASYLADNPVCEVWLRLNGWTKLGTLKYGRTQYGKTLEIDADELIRLGAPIATQIHHTNKRRGAMLNDETYWLAVCRVNHERIEQDKAWARREGFLLNF